MPGSKPTTTAPKSGIAEGLNVAVEGNGAVCMPGIVVDSLQMKTSFLDEDVDVDESMNEYPK